MVSNKSRYIPKDLIPEIERLVLKLGFRLSLDTIIYDDEVSSGSEIQIGMKWQNLGIAPPYRDHRIAFRLTDRNGVVYGSAITDQSIKGWLPGETNITVNYKLPADIPSGNYTLEMGVVFHNSIVHTIPIANKGKTDDGWYAIGSIGVNI
jgi:hypothetical protein